MIVLRDPIKRLLSFYKAIVESDGIHQRIEDLIDWKPLPFVFYKRKPICLSDYRYDRIAGAYASRFGEENVGVFKFEDLVGQPRDFALGSRGPELERLAWLGSARG